MRRSKCLPRLLFCAGLWGLFNLGPAGWEWYGTVAAGEFNPVLNIGDAAPAWENLPGVDGRQHSLSDLATKRVIVVVFTCNSCPVAQDYEARIQQVAARYAAPDSPVALVAINVNLIPEDRLDKMQQRAAEKGFTFSYLFDESQQIAKRYGAAFTPEFFVLNAQRQVIYMGGMDDNSNPKLATINYLDPAIEAGLAGKLPDQREQPARGCGIRFASERRRKKP